MCFSQSSISPTEYATPLFHQECNVFSENLGHPFFVLLSHRVEPVDPSFDHVAAPRHWHGGTFRNTIEVSGGLNFLGSFPSSFRVVHVHQSEGHDISLVHCYLTPVSFSSPVFMPCPFRGKRLPDATSFCANPIMLPSRVRVPHHVQGSCIPPPDRAPTLRHKPGTVLPHVVCGHISNPQLSTNFQR